MAACVTADPAHSALSVLLMCWCSDGSLARWLVKYDNSGKRLLNKATHELYPTRTNSVSDGKTGAGIFAAKQLEGACGRP